MYTLFYHILFIPILLLIPFKFEVEQHVYENKRPSRYNTSIKKLFHVQSRLQCQVNAFQQFSTTSRFEWSKELCTKKSIIEQCKRFKIFVPAQLQCKAYFSLEMEED